MQDHLRIVAQVAGVPVQSLQAVGGGSINQCYKVVLQNGGKLFCKLNSAAKFPQLFESEYAGLELLRASGAIRVPRVHAATEAEGWQLLLMEWIDEGERTPAFWRLFGETLVALHENAEAGFGGTADNYMGSVPQSNTAHPSWPLFFQAERLEPMIRRCSDSGALSQKDRALFENLFPKFPALFPEAAPSLLHGDLWSGNFLCAAGGQPVLLDPAVYYGHRSVDLAMTTLFGGFEKAFYEAYHYHYPFPPNYKEQWEICNLYPLLIHLYLFGESYKRPILETLQKFS
jgi:protein-ribulosamine 3-kinase